jgi:hypothetical protein
MTGAAVAHLEVVAEDQVLARSNGHRRRPKISMPRWRSVYSSAKLSSESLNSIFQDYTASNAAPAATAAA